MASIEKLIHPKKEVFFFPTDVQDFRDSMKFNQQLLQKFNEIPSLKVTGEKPKEPETPNMEQDVNDTEKIAVLEDSPSENEDSEKEENLEPPAKTAKIDKASETNEVEENVDEITDDESEEIILEEDVEMTAPEVQKSKEIVEKEPEVPKKQLPVKVAESRVSSADEIALVEQYAADFNDDLNADW